MRVGRYTIALLLGLLVVPACGGAASDSSRASGGKWELQTLNGSTVEPLPDSREPLWIEIEDEAISGWEGCNSFGVTIRPSGEDVQVAEGLKRTEVGCDDRSDEFIKVFQPGTIMATVDKQSDVLTISGPGGTATFNRA